MRHRRVRRPTIKVGVDLSRRRRSVPEQILNQQQVPRRQVELRGEAVTQRVKRERDAEAVKVFAGDRRHTVRVCGLVIWRRAACARISPATSSWYVMP